MNNEAVLRELEEAIKNASMDLDAKPFAVRTGFGVLKSEATVALPRLRNDYRERLFNNVVFFFPRGAAEKTAAFAALGTEVAGALVVDADEVYETLGTRLERSLGQYREFTVHQFTTLNDAIEDLTKSTERKLTIPSDAVRSLDATPTTADLVRYIRNLVISAHGGALAEHCIGEKVIDLALAARFTAKTLVLIVLNADEVVEKGVVAMAKTSRTSVVDVDAAPAIDRAFAINVFKEAQKAPKKTK